MLGLSSNPSQALEGFGKSWDNKYQIPKLSARSKDSTSTATASSSMSGGELSSSKSMSSFSFNSANYLLPNKMHAGRASSVSPKYGGDGSSAFNKDLHSHKSTSSDASHHQSSGHHASTSSSSFSSSSSQSSRYGHN